MQSVRDHATEYTSAVLHSADKLWQLDGANERRCGSTIRWFIWSHGTLQASMCYGALLCLHRHVPKHSVHMCCDCHIHYCVGCEAVTKREGN